MTGGGGEDGDGAELGLGAAEEADGGGGAGAEFGLEAGAVFEEDVAAAEGGGLGGGGVFEVEDLEADEALAVLLEGDGADVDAEAGWGALANEIDDIGGGDREGKALGGDHAVDAEEAGFFVGQGSAGIAGGEADLRGEPSALATEDVAGAEGADEAEGVADGDGGFAAAQGWGEAHGERGRAAGKGLDEGEVAEAVALEDLTTEAALVPEFDFDGGGGGDVGVGDEEALLVPDDAAATAAGIAGADDDGGLAEAFAEFAHVHAFRMKKQEGAVHREMGEVGPSHSSLSCELQEYGDATISGFRAGAGRGISLVCGAGGGGAGGEWMGAEFE